jgi:hypothetical protein
MSNGDMNMRGAAPVAPLGDSGGGRGSGAPRRKKSALSASDEPSDEPRRHNRASGTGGSSASPAGL